jgi:ABC-type nickel/cobalt efflux system permease component RcnA
MSQQEVMIAVVVLIAFATVRQILQDRNPRAAFLFTVVGISLGALFAGHFLTARFNKMAQSPELSDAVARHERDHRGAPAAAASGHAFGSNQAAQPTDFRSAATARLAKGLAQCPLFQLDQAGAPRLEGQPSAPPSCSDSQGRGAYR